MAKLRGERVLIHIAAGSRLDMSGLTSLDLKARTTGVYSGVTIFQSRSNNAPIGFSGASEIKFDGVLSAPGASFGQSGGGGGSGAIRSDVAIIVRDFDFSGLTQLGIDRDIGSCGSSAILLASVMAMCKGGSEVGVRLIQ